MSPPSRDLIDELASGYQASQILLTANRLGLFAALADRSKDHLQLAHDLETDPRGTRILCDALVDLGCWRGLQRATSLVRTPGVICCQIPLSPGRIFWLTDPDSTSAGRGCMTR